MEFISPDESRKIGIRFGNESIENWKLGNSTSIQWSEISPKFTLPVGNHMLVLSGKNDGITLRNIKVTEGMCDFVLDQKKRNNPCSKRNMGCFQKYHQTFEFC